MQRRGRAVLARSFHHHPPLRPKEGPINRRQLQLRNQFPSHRQQLTSPLLPLEESQQRAALSSRRSGEMRFAPPASTRDRPIKCFMLDRRRHFPCSLRQAVSILIRRTHSAPLSRPAMLAPLACPAVIDLTTSPSDSLAR